LNVLAKGPPLDFEFSGTTRLWEDNHGVAIYTLRNVLASGPSSNGPGWAEPSGPSMELPIVPSDMRADAHRRRA